MCEPFLLVFALSICCCFASSSLCIPFRLSTFAGPRPRRARLQQQQRNTKKSLANAKHVKIYFVRQSLLFYLTMAAGIRGDGRSSSNVPERRRRRKKMKRKKPNENETHLSQHWVIYDYFVQKHTNFIAHFGGGWVRYQVDGWTTPTDAVVDDGPGDHHSHFSHELQWIPKKDKLHECAMQQM